MQFKASVGIATAVIILLGAGVSARADETTTTTTRTTDAPDPGVTVGIPGVVGVHIGGSGREGCTTQKTTHTDDETGTSESRKTTDCD